ncbi:MAG: DUF4350 domain-containing protein [Gemmatimonadota bacterium]
MRPRTELAIAGGAAVTLILLAFATGTRARSDDDVDGRASSFNAGREGSRALADAAERLGLSVTRWRSRPQLLTAWVAAPGAGSAGPTTIALLAPLIATTRAERAALARLPTQRGGADLVLAGRSTNSLVTCFGYRIQPWVLDSAQVMIPGAATDSASVFVHDYLVAAAGDSVTNAAHDATIEPSVDSPGVRRSLDSGVARVGIARADTARTQRKQVRATDPIDGRADSCPSLRVVATDTLLMSTGGRLAMVRLTIAPFARSVVLISDAAVVRNRALRAGTIRALVVEAVLPRRGRLVFDEYHQGYAEGGSMAAVVLAWSRRNPLGWMVWQWCGVGLIALLAGAFRFGPVRALIPRTRRSSLEHVRALATALAASRGHRTAVGAMVRGLRRRLSPVQSATSANGDDWRRWLAALRARAPNEQVQVYAERLERLADHPESETAVLSAANAVEDLWQSLRP